MFREMRRKNQALPAEECAEGVAAKIDRFWRTLCILELTPEHISGKEAIELARRRG